MDRQQIGLKLALDVLGLPLVLDTFGDRMTIQKEIYLSQAAGIHLGYRYNWYLRGPYSPDLTRDAFELRARQRSEFDETVGWNLDDESIRKLENLKSLWSHVGTFERPRWLELLASVHFLLKTRQASSENIPNLRAILEKNSKFFSEEEIQQAIQELKQHELLPIAP
jgi:uncharacterized protein YwgA